MAMEEESQETHSTSSTSAPLDVAVAGSDSATATKVEASATESVACSPPDSDEAKRRRASPDGDEEHEDDETGDKGGDKGEGSRRRAPHESVHRRGWPSTDQTVVGDSSSSAAVPVAAESPKASEPACQREQEQLQRPSSVTEAVASLPAGNADMERTSVTPSVVANRSGYPQFLEKFKHPSALPVVNEVRAFILQFPANLTRPQAARRIHGFITAAVPKLLATEVFAEDATEDAASEGLEKFLILKLYKLLFRHAPADLREDERTEKCIRRQASTMPPLKLSGETQEGLIAAAAAELQKLDQYRAPRDKVVCMLNAYRLAESVIVDSTFLGASSSSSSERGEFQGNDSGDQVQDGHDRGALWHQVLTALLVKAAPSTIYSNVVFTTAFRHPSRITTEEQTCLTDFAQALAAIRATVPSVPAAAAVSDGCSTTAEGAGGDKPLWTAADGKSLAETLPGTLPLWLVDAGVTFHFEGRSPDGLLIGELDELLDEYHRMVEALRELAQVGGSEASGSPPPSPPRPVTGGQ